MTEQEITQARDDLALLDIDQLRCGVMLQLLNIESLTKERDEHKLLGAAMVAGLKFERDEYAKAADTMAAAHKVERDALMAAAKLALDALDSFAEWEDMGDPQRPATEAIAALREAGAQ